MIKKILLGSIVATIIICTLPAIQGVEAAIYGNNERRSWGREGDPRGIKSIEIYSYKNASGEIGYIINTQGLETIDYRVWIRDSNNNVIDKIIITDDDTDTTGKYSTFYKVSNDVDLQFEVHRGNQPLVISNTDGMQVSVDSNNLYRDDSTNPESPGTETPPGNPSGPSETSEPFEPTNINDLVARIVSDVYKFLMPIAIVVAIIKLLISLIGLGTSSGDPQKLQQAKEDILATLIGLIVIGGAVTLVNILGSAIGL